MKTPRRHARRALALGALALLALAAGCSTKPEIRSDQAPGSDLQAYRSFAFYEPASGPYMSLLESRVRQATREQLERQHYVYDERSPDLRVNYGLQVREKQALQSTAQGGLRYRGWAGTGVESVDYRQGTLLIDVVDARRQSLVWRAVAEGRLDAQALQQPGLTIDAVVAEMFTRFPAEVKR
jgi:Domain of unknown function (DUF4136)